MMIKKIVFALLTVVSVFCAKAEDNASLDYEGNVASPALSPKSVTPIKQHMERICTALQRRGLHADLIRDDQVVRVEIPCSELFAPNDNDLKDKGAQRLNEFKSILHNPTMYKVIVAVYTDDTGDETYAEDITWTRAEKVFNYLFAVANDVKSPNIFPYGMSHNEDKGPNNSIANRALNRRVEILIVPEWNMIKDAAAGKLQ